MYCCEPCCSQVFYSLKTAILRMVIYFLVNNAASGKLSAISPALVPKNAAEVDALLNASIPCKYWHILHILHHDILYILNLFYLQAEEGWENL